MTATAARRAYLCAAIDKLPATGNKGRLTVPGPGVPQETVLAARGRA